MIVTTNLPFSEWSQVIPNPRLCKALIDRLTDQAHIITTGTTPAGSVVPRRNGRRGNHEREDSKAPLSWASAQLSRSDTGGWANIRQHKWADIHCHSYLRPATIWILDIRDSAYRARLDAACRELAALPTAEAAADAAAGLADAFKYMPG